MPGKQKQPFVGRLNSARQPGLASSSVSSADGSDEAVCETERRRAHEYVERHRRRGDAAKLMPFENRQIERNLDAIMHRLRTLLRARGTLCSQSQPCTVGPAPDGKNRTVYVCLPRLSAPGGTLCQASPMVPPAKGWFLIKACARGTDRRCYAFDTQSITLLYAELRHTMGRIRSRRHEQRAPRASDRSTFTPTDHRWPQPSVPARLMSRRLDRCALAMSGHTLKCSVHPWAALIDNRSHYSAVFRANTYPRAGGAAGSRTDIAYHNCESAPSGASCVDDRWLETSSFMPTRRRLVASTGLGIAHSGGTLVDLAVASCARVDVYGAGMFSRGPGDDVVYQHHYDSRLTSHCRAPCLAAAVTTGRRDWSFPAWKISPAEVNISRHVCRPTSECDAINRTHAPSASGALRRMTTPLYASEVPEDFYFLSELRLHILHALGVFNWVWY